MKRNLLILNIALMLFTACSSKHPLHPDALGHNGIHYLQVKDWGIENLKKVHVKNCQGMVTDSKGQLILLTDDPRNNIIIFNPQGIIINQWTLNLKRPHGLTVFIEKSGREVLFITDNGGKADAVFKTTMDGKVLMKLGYPKESGKYQSARQYKPSAVLVADNGDFYVLDGYGANFIVQYDKDGKFIRIFGGTIGVGDAKLKKWGPHGGAIDYRNPDKPVLLIDCSDQQYLKRFSMDGNYIDKIPLPGTSPRDIFIHGDKLYIPHLGSDWPKQRDAPGYISVLDKDNIVIANIGGSLPHYDHDHLLKMSHHGHTFMHPHALTMDKDGNLYVAQWMSKGTWPLKFSPVK
jgi:peptidylamidoglycolate lyase